MKKINFIELIRSKKQIIKFGIVGAVTVIIDLGIYNLLIRQGLNIYWSRTISIIIAVTVGYFWHRLWTFRSKNPQMHREFMKFCIISATGLGLNLLIMRILYPVTDFIKSDYLHNNIIALIAIGIVFFWNYFMQKNWTFKKIK